ncbi:MAG: peptide-methionine (S)-S-oxide reductase MsrA [Gordonia paraffinivorans]
MSWFSQFIRGLGLGGTREMVAPTEALPGRSTPMRVAPRNIVTGAPMTGPFGDDLRQVVLAGGCFWGIEEIFWQHPGVVTTAVGYAGGFTPNPTYDEVCSGRTGHTESVLVVFDPDVVDLEGVLRVFWEAHDPTQGMRQGNDVGTQYRSAIYTADEADARLARASAETYGRALAAAGLGEITTEVAALATVGAGEFFYAEDHHQQYLEKHPNGYRCHAATGLRYPA